MRRFNFAPGLGYIALLAMLPFLFVSCAPESTETAYTPVPPEWSYSATIYEVNVRQFSEEGTFAKVQEALPRLHEMGVKILWLMPIHPIGEVERKGTMGSYYSVKDYFDVNPEFGTKEDFRDFVDAAHAMGFKVILDWVANHTAWDNPLTETNPAFFELDEDGKFMPPRGTDWSDVIQLDFDNPELWDYMIEALAYWVREFNVDGYRCDVADMVPVEFWNRARQELDAIKPVFMLAEAENPDLHPAFDVSYGWHMHHVFNAVARGEMEVGSIHEHVVASRDRFTGNAALMNFTSNHDENSWAGTVFDRMGDGAKAFAVLASTMEGMPLVYNGQETGLDKMLEFFEKDAIVWDYDSPFIPFYTALLNLKRDNPALKHGGRGALTERLETSADDAVYAYLRDAGNHAVLVMLNLSGNEVTFTVDSLPDADFNNLFTGTSTNPSQFESFSLDAWGYKVLYR